MAGSRGLLKMVSPLGAGGLLETAGAATDGKLEMMMADWLYGTVADS